MNRDVSVVSLAAIVLLIASVAGWRMLIAPQRAGEVSERLDTRAANFKGLPSAEDIDAAGLSGQAGFNMLWLTDFKSNRVLGFDKLGNVAWEQYMAGPPLPAASYNTAAEYVTVAPNGNLIVSDGEGMMVQEIDARTHKLRWQYGVKDKQGYSKGFLHQPDKAYKINGHEVVINDGNNRRVIIVDQRTDEIVWQYGETLKMGSKPGLLRGNTSVAPLRDGKEFIITDTLEKKVIIVDRATKNIVWEYRKGDAKWLQHVWPTQEGTFIMEDRQKNEVFEVNMQGEIIWIINKLADGTGLRYPTDVISLNNGHVLIAEAGRGRVVEIDPATKEITNTLNGVGFVTTIAIE